MSSVYKLFSAVLVVGLLVVPACSAQDQKTDENAGMSGEKTGDMAGDMAEAMDPQEQHDTFYALGVAMSQGLAQFHLSADELKAVQEGLSDGVLGKETKVDMQTYGPKLQALAQKRAQAAATKERAAGTDFLAQAAQEEGAVKTDSGLVFKSEEEGTGDSPKATDTVKVNYKGTLRDGTVFDSSYDRGQPATFPLNQVIPCWTEGVQKMHVGGKAKIVCPPDLAYGDRPNASIPAGSTLVFEVELLDIVKPKTDQGTMDDSGAKQDGADQMKKSSGGQG